MDKEELLERYEADGDEGLYAEAKRRYEQALAANPGDARLLEDYGYLQECHGRRSIRAAASCYERVIEADPEWVKPHLQLIGALAALRETDTTISRYQQRLAAAPDDPPQSALQRRLSVGAPRPPGRGRPGMALHHRLVPRTRIRHHCGLAQA